MATMKTPGVYIVEKNAFPNSVVEVATAVPAFIGYTEKADNKGTSLANKPWRITSMAEFETYYGGAPTKDHVRFSLAEAPAAAAAPAAGDPDPLAARDATALTVAGKSYLLKQETGRYLLYYAMQLFFLNGGGPCYVVSVGGYERDDKGQPAAGVKIDKSKLADALQALLYEQEPTMVVVPDAVSLSRQDCYALQQDVLMHCGYKMKSRFAILDVWEGYRPRKDFECIEAFRNDVGTSFLNFGAAYYPWLQSSVVSERDLSYFNLTTDSWDALKAGIKAELTALNTPAPKLAAISKDVVDKIDPATKPEEFDGLCKSLPVVSPFYRGLMAEMARRLNLLPPSAAMAGIYTMVDNTRGVWKAPANVSLNSVVAPSVTISHDDQEDLNVTPMGKSINAVRSFIGEGTLVWGARTLDGNSLDWRYVNVRRTMIMLEESIRLASKALVFEPNVSTTWVTMKSMIGNFLTSVWKRGGLAGASPDDAFSVHVGLGETMTAEDILEGILRVTVLVAITRPAEFIEITFQQQMQKS